MTAHRFLVMSRAALYGVARELYYKTNMTIDMATIFNYQSQVVAGTNHKMCTRPGPFNITLMGGQFGFVWPSARTMHPHGEYVW